MSLHIKGTPARVSQRKSRQTPAQHRSDQTGRDVQEMTSLTDQYTTSLKQQVQLLQIENTFLKQNQEQNVIARGNCYNKQRRVQDQEVTQILSRGNEVSLNGEQWCQLPSFHPPIPTIISERSNSTPHSRDRQYTEMVSRERKENGFSMVRTPSIRDHSVGTHFSDSDLLNQIEECEVKLMYYENQTKQLKEREEDHQKVIKSLSSKIKELENEKLTSIAFIPKPKSLMNRKTELLESASNEKRALMEELLELQKRIDELTPVIAEKELIISKCENEKQELTKRLRISNSDISNLQRSLAQQRDEISEKLNKENQVADEMKYLENKVLNLETSISKMKLNELELEDRISSLAQELKACELTKLNDKKRIEQLMEEHLLLVNENAKLSTKLTRFEEKEVIFQKNEIKESVSYKEETSDLKTALQAEKNTVQRLTSTVEILKRKCMDLETSIEEREKNDFDQLEERNRVEKELNALHALSKSLSAENKILREDKLESSEIIDELKLKVRNLEGSLRSSQEIYFEKEKQHTSKILELEEEALRKHQKYLEFEELSKSLHQLTSRLPSKSSELTYDCSKKQM